MITIYLLRHGNTEHNRKSVIMGQIDTPLTDEGLRTPDDLVQHIKNVDFDHIYSSDLGRAFITAHIIAEKLGKETKLTRAKELREIDYGIYANRKKDEVKKECPKYKTNAEFIFPEGESFLQMQKRAVKFIKQLEKEHKGKTLLLITHAGVIRAIKTYFNEWNMQEHLNMRIPHEYIGKLEIENGKKVSYKKLNP